MSRQATACSLPQLWQPVAASQHACDHGPHQVEQCTSAAAHSAVCLRLLQLSGRLFLLQAQTSTSSFNTPLLPIQICCHEPCAEIIECCRCAKCSGGENWVGVDVAFVWPLASGPGSRAHYEPTKFPCGDDIRGRAQRKGGEGRRKSRLEPQFLLSLSRPTWPPVAHCLTY